MRDAPISGVLPSPFLDAAQLAKIYTTIASALGASLAMRMWRMWAKTEREWRRSICLIGVGQY